MNLPGRKSYRTRRGGFRSAPLCRIRVDGTKILGFSLCGLIQYYAIIRSGFPKHSPKNVFGIPANNAINIQSVVALQIFNCIFSHTTKNAICFTTVVIGFVQHDLQVCNLRASMATPKIEG